MPAPATGRDVLPGLPGLPEGYRVRRPDPTADVGAVLAVWQADDLEVLGAVEVTRAEVSDALDAPYSRPDVDQWLVLEPSGRVVAWGGVMTAYPGEDDDVDAYVVPGQPPQVRGALLDALLDRAAERATSRSAATPRVFMGVVLGDRRWEPLLRERGFAVARVFARMKRPLDATLPPALPPPGVSVRTFDPTSERDWRDFHRIQMTAFRDHWESHEASYEDWRTRVDAEEQRFDRWWLADDAELGPVAMCQGTVQLTDVGGGWVRNLGVLREARGRGIARCLLLQAMAAFGSDGLQWCGLGVDTQNETGAVQLYESVGMTPSFQARAWGRPLESAVEPPPSAEDPRQPRLG